MEGNRMRVLIGGIYQEANTFSGIKVTYEDFRRYHGEEILKQLPQCQRFIDEGMEIIPAAYARIIPSAPMASEEFDKFLEDFFDACKDAPTPDAIYLNLHGAMYIQGRDSGEYLLVKALREKYGSDLPIFASFDFHGNMTPKLARLLNYVTAYKTAPHVDEAETVQRAVEALIGAMKTGKYPRVECISFPMTFPGEMVITKDWPSCDILEGLRAVSKDGLALEASWFCGFIWSDAPDIFMSIAVTAYVFDEALRLRMEAVAGQLWGLRKEFHFSTAAMDVEEAMDTACAQALKRPAGDTVFLSDTGDNVTAGTSGDNAFMAGALMDFVKKHPIYGRLKILVSGIADPKAVSLCHDHEPGENFFLAFGSALDLAGTRVRAEVTLLGKGKIPATGSSPAMDYAHIRCQGIEILLNSGRFAYTEPEQFARVGASVEDYDVICIKLGYLYPKLAQIAGEAVMAFSPGNAPLKPELIPYKVMKEPFYPKQDVDFVPKVQWRI